MTYVTEQTSEELRAHMRRLQAMPGWHNPLDDRLWKEVQTLESERDQLRAEVERLRGERMVFVELVRDLLQVVDTIQPHSDEMNEIEMLHALTTRARSAIDGVLRAIEAAKEA